MTNEDEDEKLRRSQQQSNQQNIASSQQESMEHLDLSLVDELQIQTIYEPMVGLEGKIYCPAGRNAPVAEFTDEYLILHPPQKPLYEQGPEEDIVIQVDERGILLDELGEAKKIKSAKFKGYPIYYFGEQKEGTLKHFAVVLTGHDILHFILDKDGERLTTDQVYRFRNKSHDGEISVFPGLTCDFDAEDEQFEQGLDYEPEPFADQEI